jgi:hypothetical protein
MRALKQVDEDEVGGPDFNWPRRLKFAMTRM